jgi:hypothetical protein
MERSRFSFLQAFSHSPRAHKQPRLNRECLFEPTASESDNLGKYTVNPATLTGRT